jgi:hypothetical protein
MKQTRFPYIKLPDELLTLLKSNISVSSSPTPVFDIIRPNRGLFMILEKAFKDLDDGRGLEKTMLALGWSNFRERMTSLYIYKSIYGDFPVHTQMELVDDIRALEVKFQDHSVFGPSRVFMLGLYLRLANINIQNRENNQYFELKIPDEVSGLLKLSQGRTERIDWLILITMHLKEALGEKLLANSLASGKKFEELYDILPTDKREEMLSNLLAYGASIKEQDFFTYDKI